LAVERWACGLQQIQGLTGALAADGVYKTAAIAAQNRIGRVGFVVGERYGNVFELGRPRVVYRDRRGGGSYQNLAVERVVVVTLHHNIAGVVGGHVA
jgi:hypothetical protein